MLVWLHGIWNVECGDYCMLNVNKNMLIYVFVATMERGREVVDLGVLESSTVQWGVRLHPAGISSLLYRIDIVFSCC